MKQLVALSLMVSLAACQSTQLQQIDTVTIPDTGAFTDLNSQRNDALLADIDDVKQIIEAGLRDKYRQKYDTLLSAYAPSLEQCEVDAIETLQEKEQCLSAVYNQHLQSLHIFVANSRLKNIAWFNISSVESYDYSLNLDGYYHYFDDQSRMKLFISEANIQRNPNDNQYVFEVVRSFDMALYKKPFAKQAEYIKLGEYTLNTVIDRFSEVKLENLSFELDITDIDYSTFEFAAAVHMDNHDVEATTSKGKLKQADKLVLEEKPATEADASEEDDNNSSNPWIN